MKNGFDNNKRRTLKLLAGGAASSLVIGLSPSAAANSAATTSVGFGGDLIDCVLISRADSSRIHMLMHNNTSVPIVANRMGSQLVVFGGVAVNMADAYVNPVIIPPNDRLMVRLDWEAARHVLPFMGDVVDLNVETKYLPKGTREVLVTIRIIDGVGKIESNPVFA